MNLTSEWKLQWFEPNTMNPLEISAPYYIDHFWMTTNVPGDVHSTLIDKNLIEDPFVGHNDLKCRWIEEKEWWYRTTFHWEDNCNDEECLELNFEGLDTYATVFLNGLEIGSTANMLVEHTFDISDEIRKGKNVLAVKFDPLSVHIAEKERDYWCSYGKERIWARKSAMNFGWDWGPRLVTTGIWKDVQLKKHIKAKFDSVFIQTAELSDEAATVNVQVDVGEQFYNQESLRFEVELTSGEDLHTAKGLIEKDTGQAEIYVRSPKLWWTHDLGSPHLYDCTIRLLDEADQTIDEHQQKFGIREVKVEQKHENNENLFTFNLNGVRLFAKGANWIPVHNFIGAVEDDRYRDLLALAKDAHMNMMRVWGGGIYEKEIFYDQCDQLGLLVWQDFMFANALYPDYNKNFMNNVRDEVTKVVKRLRNHTSLALWCGNNEIDWIYDRKSSGGEITTPFYGEKIYHHLIPRELKELDPTRLYWPSSPFGGNDLDAENIGDRHNWQVWHGNVEPRKIGEPVEQDISLEGVSFKNYKKDLTLFSSEFGMHASSNRYTLDKFIPDGQFYWKSDEMSYRNKDHFHEKGILLMEGYTGVPETIEDYMNFSMLTQAEGLKYGIEHYRRRKPFTSGALIWQLNDCWPGTSWSMIDYELLPKASHYYAKKFFDPVMACLEHDPGRPLSLWIINDRLDALKDTLVFEVSTFGGSSVFSKELEINIESNDTIKLAEFTEEAILDGIDASEVVVRLQSKNGHFQDNVYFLRDFKDITYPLTKLEVKHDANEQTITITSDKLARFVTVDFSVGKAQCSDNFFDLWPSESKTIQLSHLDDFEIKRSDFSVHAINSNHE
ncbi:beta-mannosidase [Halobacillus seohaensis]|uniref:Beta-mannosidase B n=1 Tax=Halobacillus seohaensis TaxID=447421 RepID=A0ABW2EM21_9BACI